jgi:hypothetical protein
VLQDHRVDVPLAGHLLPDQRGGGLAAVPAVPGGSLPALLPVRHPGHVHVRLHPVADAAAGQGRRHPRGPAARDLQLAHGGRAGRAGPGAGRVPTAGPQAEAPARAGAAGDGRRRRQPAGGVPDHALRGGCAGGGRGDSHHDPAGAGRDHEFEPVRDRPVAAGLHPD